MMKRVFLTVACTMFIFSTVACSSGSKMQNTTAVSAISSGEEMGTGSAQGQDTVITAYPKGQYKIKIATVMSGEHAWVKMADYMAEELAARSNGAFEVTVASGGQLGNDETTIDDMRLGTLDIVIGGTQNAAPFVSQYQILSMPYLFDSRTEFESVLMQNGDVFKYIQEKYDENGHGLKLLGLSNGGQRDLHTGIEIKTVNDIKNLKMRVTSSATESMVWSALGTIPTSMSFNDIYSGIQTNTVNAFECTLAAYNSNALYEVAPYHVKTAHQFTPSHITCSAVTWNKLPADLQELLFAVSDEAAVLGSRLANEADDTLLDMLIKDKGVKVCEPNREEFKEKVEPLYSEIAKSCKGEDLLTMIQDITK